MIKIIFTGFQLSLYALLLFFTDASITQIKPDLFELNLLEAKQQIKSIPLSFHQDAPFTPEQLEKAKAIIAKVTAEDKAEVDAKTKYKMFCAACHGPNGDLEINGSKDLSKSILSREESVARIYYGGGMMTGFGALLTEAEMVALAEFVETQFRK